MDHVLAKVKRYSKKPYFKLLSDHTLFEGPNVIPIDCVPYSPDHNLDEDSWFKVEKFSEQPFTIELLKEDFDTKDFDDLKKEQFPNIAYIFSIQNENVYFQKITPSLFIKKKFIDFGEAAKIEESNNRLVINDRPDAVYFKNFDTLVFRNLGTISGIFKDIDSLYREATQQETESFLQTGFIDLKEKFGASKVSKPNRKRIALAMVALDEMSEANKLALPDYIGKYCEQKIKLNEGTGKFEISTDVELKFLLYGIGQRFYTTEFGKKRRLANSIQALD